MTPLGLLPQGWRILHYSKRILSHQHCSWYLSNLDLGERMFCFYAETFMFRLAFWSQNKAEKLLVKMSGNQSFNSTILLASIKWDKRTTKMARFLKKKLNSISRGHYGEFINDFIKRSLLYPPFLSLFCKGCNFH